MNEFAEIYVDCRSWKDHLQPTSAIQTPELVRRDPENMIDAVAFDPPCLEVEKKGQSGRLTWVRLSRMRLGKWR
ncbi:hypothetical protein CALCODRAFT_504543 [Calocera cornea HHB12733]|uniref:Uncharacterized protein n=1 Tax=Calocera cornea HHB12733 TaxID=1353952 RepID=A0A165CCG3_9BASI|nr:hypothetical protein CALCODRAFT_504958 [Calocera cornea HHB12733]KZT50578.1 hypothetical protein CALCODRAFT_504543 [Calocera cornea HHB12733]